VFDLENLVNEEALAHWGGLSCQKQTNKIYNFQGDGDGAVVKVLCYKYEGHWFDPSWNFLLT